MWLHDQQARHPVSKCPMRCIQPDVITGLDASKRAEERIAMARQRGVSRLPGQRRVRQVADCHLQRLLVIALDHDGREPDAWNLETSDWVRRIMRSGGDITSAIRYRPIESGTQSIQPRLLFDLVGNGVDQNRADPYQAAGSESDETALNAPYE
jgi:hypothetical protein